MAEKTALKEARFAAEFLVLRNGTQAAINAGWSARTAHVTASKLLKKPNVLALLHEGESKQLEALQLEAEDLTRMWSQIATVDRNELAEIRRVCCRYCHGEGFQYQETPAERRARRKQYDLLLAQITKSAKPGAPMMAIPPFDEMGGVGYHRNRLAHPDCPECFGDGETYVYLRDTRELSPQAKAVYEGIDIKNGSVVVKMFSREAATVMLAKRFGIGDKLVLPGIGNADPDAIPDEPIEASRAYQRMITGGG